MIYQNDPFLRNGRIKDKNDEKNLIFSKRFDGPGRRIQKFQYGKGMYFFHNSASEGRSIEHHRINLIEAKAHQTHFIWLKTVI